MKWQANFSKMDHKRGHTRIVFAVKTESGYRAEFDGQHPADFVLPIWGAICRGPLPVGRDAGIEAYFKEQETK